MEMTDDRAREEGNLQGEEGGMADVERGREMWGGSKGRTTGQEVK